MERPKILLNPKAIEDLNALALRAGHTQEWFDKWVDDVVIELEPIKRTWWQRLTRRW